MLTLRFQRQGRKKDFIFRVVAIDSRFSVRSGKVKDILGWWNPKTDKFNLNKERIVYWLEKGAQPTDSCYNLLVKAKIISGEKKKVNIKKKKETSTDKESANRVNLENSQSEKINQENYNQ